jgi:hypothetical protein
LNIAFILSQELLVLGYTGPLPHDVGKQILADLVPHCFDGIPLRNFSADLGFPTAKAINGHPYCHPSLKPAHPVVIALKFLKN